MKLLYDNDDLLFLLFRYILTMFRFILFYLLLTFSYSQNSIYVVGDTQRTGFWEKYLLFRESNDSIPFILFDKIKEFKNDRSIILHLGDMVYSGASENDWKRFDSYTDKIFETIFPVLGNHEYFGDRESSRNLINHRFPMFKEKTWYAKQVNSVALIFLNSNFSEISQLKQEEQLDWFKNTIKRFNGIREIKHIIILSHHPPFTNGVGIGFSHNSEIQTTYLPLLKKSVKVKLFLSGHCHSYERFEKDKIHFIVSGGGGGPRRSINLSGAYKDISGIDSELRDFNFLELIENDSLIIKNHMYNNEKKNWYIGDEFVIK